MTAADRVAHPMVAGDAGQRNAFRLALGATGIVLGDIDTPGATPSGKASSVTITADRSMPSRFWSVSSNDPASEVPIRSGETVLAQAIDRGEGANAISADGSKATFSHKPL